MSLTLRRNAPRYLPYIGAAYRTARMAYNNPRLVRAAASGVRNAVRTANSYLGKRRRTDEVYSNKRRTNKPNSRALFNARTAKTTRLATRIGGKRTKKKRTIKVGKQLRKKIKHVVDHSDQVVGTHIYAARPLALVQNVDNRKTWVMFPGFENSLEAFTGFPRSGEVFSWNIVLDAASKLFNGKPNIEYPDVGDTNNFESKTLEVDIDYCKVKFWIKNNTERNVCLQMWKCTSKSKIGGDYGPLELWKRASLNNTTSGLISSSLICADLNDQAGTTVYRNVPTFNSQWRDNWATEKVQWILAPGQTDSYSFTVPADKMSGVKNYIDNAYQSYHKGAIYCMWSVYYDVINVSSTNTDPGVAGYFLNPEPVGNAQHAVLIEMERTIKMSVPEQSGGFSAAAGVREQNTFRKSNTVFEEYIWPLPSEPKYSRVDEETPYANFNT